MKSEAKKSTKKKVMIVDDSWMNREMLSEMLGEKYEYMYASDGLQAIELLNNDTGVDIMLLDINMPNMDGFEVLRIMNERHWIEEIPVVVISAESDILEQVFELGAIDCIARPFRTIVVQHRVENSIKLYVKQKNLVSLVKKQVLEREKINNIMINIFSHAIESRNSESGNHTLHIQTITNLLLRHLMKMTDKYELSQSDIAMISSVSALHDIGKITIPESILNKPGKLTDEEWIIMKSHTVRGEEFLNAMSDVKSEKYMITAHEICRWHHERWDGKGYPDGLAGDQIPISAQVVSLADVYDALTSERCYKQAFSHEQAIRMICNGECGVFNPLLIQCLLDISDDLLIQLDLNMNNYNYQSEAYFEADEVLATEEDNQIERSSELMNLERTKKEFFALQCGGIQFEYDRQIHKIRYLRRYNRSGVRIPLQEDSIRFLTQSDLKILNDQIKSATRENPKVEMNVMFMIDGRLRWHKLVVQSLWVNESTEYIGLVGQLTDIHDKILRKDIPYVSENSETLTYATYLEMQDIFQLVRLVDPEDCTVLEFGPDGHLIKTEYNCYKIWGRSECCQECISCMSYTQKRWASKLEINEGDIYSVLAKHVRIDQRECVLEIAFAMKNPLKRNENSPQSDIDKFMLLNFYKDAVTTSYSRTYFEDFFLNFESSEAVAIGDVDQFKQINDTYGHMVGDLALKHISGIIASCIREGDVLIRYGGDEFLLLFNKITEKDFEQILSNIEEKVKVSKLDNYPDMDLNISIGGVYHVYPLVEAIDRADKEMYKNKLSK